MAHYLIQAAYTPESWKAQTGSPESPVDRLRPLVEKLGGRIVTMYYAFGEYDVVAVFEMPGDESAAAFAIAAGAGGAVKALKTTPLLTVDQGLDSLRKAAGAASLYRVPGRQPAGV